MKSSAPTATPSPRLREMVDEFDIMPRLHRRFRKLAIRSPRLVVCAVTLTYPSWARIDWFFKSAHWLARDVLRPGESLWLVADKHIKGKKGANGLHWDGLTLLESGHRIRRIHKAWRRRIRTSRSALSFSLVRGQDKDRSGRYFRKNLGDYVEYCCKRRPGLELTLPERTVVSGDFEKSWAEVFDRLPQGPYAILEVHQGVVSPAVLSRPAGPRLCRDCGEPLPSSYPANKWHHDDTCSRQRAYVRHKRSTDVMRSQDRDGTIPAADAVFAVVSPGAAPPSSE